MSNARFDLELEWHESLSMQTATCEVAGLGTILIHWDSGWAVDINGLRAWSQWRGTIRNVQLGMQDHVRMWHYLNGFVK